MSTFIAALDQSINSAPATLERYGVTSWKNKKELRNQIHDMRLRIVTSRSFTLAHIDTVILFKESVDRGIVPIIQKKGIQSYLKIDSGLADDGSMIPFDIEGMISYAEDNGCSGTKMRSVVRSPQYMNKILDQQFKYAELVSEAGLIPIIEPEIPINNIFKTFLEFRIEKILAEFCVQSVPQVVLKLTLPNIDNTYEELSRMQRIAALSGGHPLHYACAKLAKNKNMCASFSRALLEGLHIDMSEEEFGNVLLSNIMMIYDAGNLPREV